MERQVELIVKGYAVGLEEHVDFQLAGLGQGLWVIAVVGACVIEKFLCPSKPVPLLFAPLDLASKVVTRPALVAPKAAAAKR